MGVEIERKFLVDHEKWEQLPKPEGTHYRQGYILSNKEQTVRVRVSDKKAYINLKSKVSDISRKEYEYEIPLEDGVEILNEFTKNGTKKTRYRIPFDGKTWEIDVFEGDNDGLIVAELELQSESEEFRRPDWVTTEVTDEGKYTNASLAVNPFSKW